MKKMHLYPFVFILFLWNSKALSQAPAVQTINIKNDAVSIEYVKTDPDTLAVVRYVKINLNFFSSADSGNKNKTVEFMIDATTAPKSSPVVGVQPFTIAANEFSTVHATREVTVPVLIHGMKTFEAESFTIGLKDVKDGGYMRATLQEKPTDEPVRKTPLGFTYLNAVNFDFQNTSGTGYVGHLNIFQPDVGRINLKRERTRFLNTFGLNLGIMKINYAKGGDSINTSYNYPENVLTNPLDSIKKGTKFYRQYNSLSTTSKNASWSFYFQPALNLLYRPDFKLLFHIHTELFVNSWTTTTTIKNLKQQTDSMTAFTPDTLKLVPDNRFEKSLTDPVTTTISNTNLSFYVGAGLTMFVKLWDGGSLFVQPTIGWATAYRPPDRQVTEAKFLQQVSKENSKSLFHLTRFELKQDLNTKLQAVIGVNVRGRFGDAPIYAAYVGINLGLEGIKSLFNNK